MRPLKILLALAATTALSACVVAPYDGGYYGGGAPYYGGPAYGASSFVFSYHENDRDGRGWHGDDHRSYSRDYDHGGYRGGDHGGHHGRHEEHDGHN